jgi:hypothetical protein
LCPSLFSFLSISLSLSSLLQWLLDISDDILFILFSFNYYPLGVELLGIGDDNCCDLFCDRRGRRFN